MAKFLLAVTFISIGAGVAFGPATMPAAAVLGTLVLLAGFVLRRALVHIPDMEVGVVVGGPQGAFQRFLPPGRHWLLPFVERLAATISTAPGSLANVSHGVVVSGGLSLSVAWNLSYTLDPFQIPAPQAGKLARTLPRKTAVLAANHMHNVIQHVLGELTLDDLCQPGVHRRLERQVRQAAAERLAPFGIGVSRVMIGAIELPAHVRQALEAAQERRLQAEQEARALARLQQAVSQFSDTDMQRLLELERLHHMGQNGVTLMVPGTAAQVGTAQASTAQAGRPRTSPLRQPVVVSPH